MIRKCFIICLVALMLMGCQIRQQEPEEKYQFYYPRTHVLYGSEEGVLAPEARDVRKRGRGRGDCVG